MRNRWEHYNKPALRREVRAPAFGAPYGRLTDADYAEFERRVATLPTPVLPRTSPVWNSLVQGLMKIPVVDELRAASKLSYMQIKRPKVRPYEGVVFTNNAFRDMLGKRFFVNVAGAATGRLSSTTPTPRPQVPKQGALSGHSSDGSGIQKHSVGDTYPFIVQGFEHEGRTMYEWVNHQKRWAGRLCCQAVTAYKSVQMLLKYGTEDLSPSTLKSFKESYEARHGHKRYSPVPPKPVNGSDFARIKTLADLKPSESAAARPYEQPYTRHGDQVYRVVLDDDSVLWLSYLPSEKSLLDSPKTGRHQLIKGITTYRREK
jgi:hypothetical protein